MAKPVFNNQQVINQLDSGWHWTSGGQTANSITYGITTSNNWTSAIMPEFSGWSAFNTKQVAAANLAMENWVDLIDVNVTIASNPDDADIRFSNTSTGISYAHAYYPGNTGSDNSINQIAQGSIWLNSGYGSLNDPDLSEYGFMAIMHEIGHALGLSHPGTYNGGSPNYTDDALYEQDTHQFTIMSYFAANETGADWWAGNGVWQWAQTPMVHDILAIQEIYGADLTTRSGDTVYGFNSNVGNYIYDFTINLNPVLTIWDGDGNDTLDFSGWNTGSNISLVEGEFSDGNFMTQNIAIAFGAVIENATGGDGNDRISGNAADNILSGRSGADDIRGESGNDMLFGALGDDTLDGGDGDDIVSGGDGLDSVSGGAGADLVLGGNQNDSLFGEDGNDTLSGGGGDDFLSGGNNDDLILGALGNDTNFGGAGSDTISGGGGLDNVDGGAGNDYIFGAGGNDMVSGGGGDDTISGGTGDDTVFGNDGNDNLIGAGGNDVLDGGGGIDFLSGGAGADILAYSLGYEFDTMQGFEDNIDTIQLNQALWGGGLTAAQMVTTFATQLSPGIVEFDFGGGDILRVYQGNGIAAADLIDDIAIV